MRKLIWLQNDFLIQIGFSSFPYNLSFLFFASTNVGTKLRFTTTYGEAMLIGDQAADWGVNHVADWIQGIVRGEV